jgi:outer membrane protein assembly factor BamD
MVRNRIGHAMMFGVGATLLFSSGCAHKYENPITKDTQQPDKVLFDTSIDDIEHGRYERARLTLQTMMNTYDTSEYLAKAKLAVADSWKKEGGAHGMAQAEAEYKDFILFYPNMEEAAEAQFKICDMQYQQMDKPDRDNVHARLGDAECKDVLQKWPNSPFATEAADKLRKIQEVLAAGEMTAGLFYEKKGGNGYYSAANRFDNLVNQYPLYSQADYALWLAADAYNQMGDRYENQQAADYARIVRDYPLSAYADQAKNQLKAMGRPVPDADPVAEARMKFELENRTKRSLMSKVLGGFSDRPDTSLAAKSGNPTQEAFKPTIPLNVPDTARGTGATTNDVTLTPVTTRDILDKAPDARATAAGTPETPATPTAPVASPAADPSANLPGKPTANASLTATAPTEGTPAANIAATAANANAKAAKKPKPAKTATVKRRPRPADKPADKKGTAQPPAPTTPPPPATAPVTTPAAAPAKTSGSGGNAPEVPQA